MSTPPVIWRALPGSQALVMSCPCSLILYDGTRGPGKTDSQLMLFRKNVGRGYGPAWRGIIFDREYKNLDDLIQKSKRWFPQFKDGAKWLSSKSDYKWVWPTGEELLFRQMKREADYWNYHGQEFPYIGWNELTKQSTPVLFDAMFSCNRSSFVPALHAPIDPQTGQRIHLPNIPLVVMATTNPYGPGHNWVKERFIDVAPPGVPVARSIEVFNPRTQQRETITKYQVRIFGSYKENIYLDPDYIAELEGISDENKRKAWLWGDWNIVAGGALDDLWSDKLILPRFKVPRGWKVDRALDWGSSHPFSVGWWAEANGEEARLPDGTTFCPPPGTLIRIAEWYGKGKGSNVGLVMSARNVARGILEREAAMLEGGWISKKPAPGPADNQIYDVTDEEVESIAKRMEDEGVLWERSNKSSGSRVNGLQLVRDRLEASADNEGPGLYFMDNCRAAISTLPVLPRDPDNMDDVDTTAEDHVYDEVRYRVLKGKDRTARKLQVVFGGR